MLILKRKLNKPSFSTTCSDIFTIFQLHRIPLFQLKNLTSELKKILHFHIKNPLQSRIAKRLQEKTKMSIYVMKMFSLFELQCISFHDEHDYSWCGSRLVQICGQSSVFTQLTIIHSSLKWIQTAKILCIINEILCYTGCRNLNDILDLFKSKSAIFHKLIK